MAARLPPPDPHEPHGSPARDEPVAAPMVVFTRAPVSPEVDRVAERVLDLRPGILVVVAR